MFKNNILYLFLADTLLGLKGFLNHQEEILQNNIYYQMECYFPFVITNHSDFSQQASSVLFLHQF